MFAICPYIHAILKKEETFRNDIVIIKIVFTHEFEHHYLYPLPFQYLFWSQNNSDFWCHPFWNDVLAISSSQVAICWSMSVSLLHLNKLFLCNLWIFLEFMFMCGIWHQYSRNICMHLVSMLEVNDSFYFIRIWDLVVFVMLTLNVAQGGMKLNYDDWTSFLNFILMLTRDPHFMYRLFLWMNIYKLANVGWGRGGKLCVDYIIQLQICTYNVTLHVFQVDYGEAIFFVALDDP